MSHSLPQNHTPASDSPDDQSTHSDHALRSQPPTDECAQDHVHSSKNTVSSSSTSTAAPDPSNPVKSESPTQSCPSISMSQPTTPRPTSGLSPTTRQFVEPTTTQPLLSPPLPTQHETHTFALRVPPPSPYSYQSNDGNNLGKRRRREFDCTSETPTFGMTQYKGNVYVTDRSTILDVAVYAKVHHGFFLADNIWTCYRRNYFQISAAFALQGVAVLCNDQAPPCFVQDDQCTLHPVEQFYIGIYARLSNCDTRIQLVQHTVKRDKGPQNIPESKPIRPGGNLSIGSVVGANQSIVTYERLQFKSATPNNGKRRASQQYYVVVMELYAKIQSSGEMIPVASTTSQPLVVRGRSPSHYEPSSTTVGPSVRYRQPPTHYQHYQHQTPFTPMPPMVPGHHHTPPYPSHVPSPSPPPPPPGMYAPGYCAPYHHYPATAYRPSPAGVLMVSNTDISSSSPNKAYDHHPPTTSQPTTTPPLQQQHRTQPRPIAPSSNTSGHSDSSLPPPMQRSESAPSITYDHPVRDEHAQHHQPTHFRMASTPDHPCHATSSSNHTSHGPSIAVGVPYPQPPPVPYYYHSPSSRPSPSHDGYNLPPPPPVESAPPADHGYPSNWKQWRPPNCTNAKKQRVIKMSEEKDGFRTDIIAEPDTKDKDPGISGRT